MGWRHFPGLGTFLKVFFFLIPGLVGIPWPFNAPARGSLADVTTRHEVNRLTGEREPILAGSDDIESSPEAK